MSDDLTLSLFCDNAPKRSEGISFLRYMRFYKRQRFSRFYSRLGGVMLALILCGLLTSCATIYGRSRYNISFNTHPTKAYVKVIDVRGNVVAQGITPTTFRLKSSDGYLKRADYSVLISKDGYEDARYSLTASIDPNYFWNLFSWSLIGMFLIDPVTGAMWKFEGDSYSVDLTPSRSYVERPSVNPPMGNNHNNNNNSNNNTNVNQNNINIIIKKSDLE